jgi:hypothetical protein
VTDDGSSSRDTSDKTAATDGGDAELAPSFGAAIKLCHPVAVTVSASDTDAAAGTSTAAATSIDAAVRRRHRSRSAPIDVVCGVVAVRVAGGGAAGRRRRGSSIDRTAAAADENDRFDVQHIDDIFRQLNADNNN